MPIKVISVGDASDGDPNRRPAANMGFVRNDEYFLEKIAEKWSKDLSLTSGVTYRLDHLPAGYAGFQKKRGGDSTHVDRYVYGHRSGTFRSLNEFYPHFKHLMDNGSNEGCQCKLCATGTPARKLPDNKSNPSSQPARSSAGSARPTARKSVVRRELGPKQSVLRNEEPDMPSKRQKQMDSEGTPDIYRQHIDRLAAAGHQVNFDERITEPNSPDWRASHPALPQLLHEWSTLPQYIPRIGDVVLFVRNMAPEKLVLWDTSEQMFCLSASQNSSAQLTWEAGVVTQMPIEELTSEDLGRVPSDKKLNVINSGFRVEPLDMPATMRRKCVKKHCYVPLHATRPFSLWKECVGPQEDEWHPTVRHAIATASSFSLVDRYHFKGKYPEATIFCRAVYLGHELLARGNVVRLKPKDNEQSPDKVTDIMKITSIKLLLVDLHESTDDDYDDERPYGTCLHICGSVFTQDHKRSFNGMDTPISSTSDVLPPGVMKLGKWYHALDPENPRERMELPFTRVLDRCPEVSALNAWYGTPVAGLSHGLAGILDARERSRKLDPRINIEDRKAWFWADTRIEQLDLQEVNGHGVGAKDVNRNKASMSSLRKSLKAMDDTNRFGGATLDKFAADVITKSRASPIAEVVETMDVDPEEKESTPQEVDLSSEENEEQRVETTTTQVAPVAAVVNRPADPAEHVRGNFEVIDLEDSSDDSTPADLSRWKAH